MSGRASRISAAATPPRILGVDPSLLPDQYALVCEGDCMEPEIADGSCLLFSKSERYAAGDLVILYLRPELVAPGDYQAIVKRIIYPPPSGLAFPHEQQHAAEISFIVVVAQINPPRRFAIPCADLLAIHKCLGPVPPDLKRIKTSVKELVALSIKKRGRN